MYIIDFSGFISELNELGIPFKENVKLQDYTYLRTGGVSRLIVYPRNTNDVSKVVQLMNYEKLRFKTIGATSNLIFLDKTTYTCLLCTKYLKGVNLNYEKNIINAGAGEMLSDLSRFALYNSVEGFEGLEGIPGTVGGAVFMNAGAYGYEIKDVLKYVKCVDYSGNTRKIDWEELKFGKRCSAFRKGDICGIITECVFNLKPGNPSLISNKMEIFHAKRHKYQDFLYPSLGSIFSGQVYKALGRKDRYFKLVSAFFYLFGYKWKIFRRESPLNRKWINDLAVKRFKLYYDLQPFSDKTINCLVNRGQGTDEMINYIRKIEELTDGKIPVENEIVEAF